MAADTNSAKRKSYTPEEKLTLVLELQRKRAEGWTYRNFAKEKGMQASWLNKLEKEYMDYRHRAFVRDQSGLITSLKKQNNRLRTEVSRLKSELARVTMELEQAGRIPLAEVGERSGLAGEKFRHYFQRMYPEGVAEGMMFTEGEAKAVIDQIYGMVDGFTSAELCAIFNYDRHKLRRFIDYIEEMANPATPTERAVQREAFPALWRYFFRRRRHNKGSDHFFPPKAFAEMERLKPLYEKATPTRKRVVHPRKDKATRARRASKPIRDDRFID